MDQADLGIDADMRFHSEMLLIVHLSLGHLGVELIFLVLGRTGNRDQCGINDGGALHSQVFLRQHAESFGEDGGRQIVFLQQILKAPDGAFVRHDVFEGIQFGKVVQQGNVVQGIFHGTVRLAKPLLDEINAQHLARRHRRTAAFLPRIVRLDQFSPAGSAHDGIGFRQEHRQPGLLPGFRQITGFG